MAAWVRASERALARTSVDKNVNKSNQKSIPIEIENDSFHHRVESRGGSWKMCNQFCKWCKNDDNEMTDFVGDFCFLYPSTILNLDAGTNKKISDPFKKRCGLENVAL